MSVRIGPLERAGWIGYEVEQADGTFIFQREQPVPRDVLMARGCSRLYWGVIILLALAAIGASLVGR